MLFRSLLAATILMCGTAHAKRFRNAYVSFDLPPNWSCKLEGSEWVCENEFFGKTKEAIIILTAKEVGPTDTLAAYMAHLQTPRMLPGRGGQPVKSVVYHTKERMISNQLWIDSMHLGSEVGPYFTRYLATIKDKIAILVTFSAHKEHYTKYSNDFVKAVESLRVVATKDSLGERGGGPNLGGAGSGANGPIGASIDQGPSPFTDNLPEESQKKGGLTTYLAIAGLLAALGGYFFLVNKRKQKKPKSKPKSPSGGGGAPKPPSSSSKKG